MSVLVLDDDDDVREALADLSEYVTGQPAVAAASVGELMAQADNALACELALLDVNLGAGAPSGLDALDWLERRSFGGRVVFLTGHAAAYPQLVRLADEGRALVMAKPIELDQLRALVRGRRAVAG